MKYIIVFLIAFVFVSCDAPNMRVRIVENNTISYVTITDGSIDSYRVRDTIWVNLHKHEIADTDTTAMKAIILSK